MTEQTPAVNDEAVEAAARAMFVATYGVDQWNGQTAPFRKNYTDTARAALTAALPFLSQQVDPREQIARAIEAETQDAKGVLVEHWRGLDFMEGRDAGLEDAARVARETPLTGGGEAVDLDSMPIRQRDELVAATLRFMRDRGYVVTMPALSPAPEGEKR